jgi:transcriptional regulator GlxA family with amidase domain
MFRQRNPEVKRDESRMVVRSGTTVTAGAALSHIDVALALIRQTSPELASLVARYLVVDAHPSQSAYAISDHPIHADPLVERFERWAPSHLNRGFSLDEAADAIATSKRTLARRLEDTLGKTPLSYFQDLRVERAAHLLKTTITTSSASPRWLATPTASPCARCCGDGLDAACANCAP